MGKVKPNRSMALIGEAQQKIEETHSNKFQETRPPAEAPKISAVAGRKYPQVSYTISPEDKEIMDSLTVYETNRKGKSVKPSEVLRTLLRFADKHREEVFE